MFFSFSSWVFCLKVLTSWLAPANSSSSCVTLSKATRNRSRTCKTKLNLQSNGAIKHDIGLFLECIQPKAIQTIAHKHYFVKKARSSKRQIIFIFMHTLFQCFSKSPSPLLLLFSWSLILSYSKCSTLYWWCPHIQVHRQRFKSLRVICRES